MNSTKLLNVSGAIFLCLFLLADLILLPVAACLANQSLLPTFQRQFFSAAFIIAYIICQGRFNGLLECISGILAACSQIFVGYGLTLLVKDEWASLSSIERAATLIALIIPALIAFTIAAIVLGLVILLFWGSFTTLIDLFREDRFKEFKKKGNRAHVIITGGGTGLGATTAIAFAKMGAGHVTILSRNQAHLDVVVQKMKKVAKFPAEQHFHTLVADVTKAAALRDILDQHIKTTATPDLVIACAGLSKPGYFMETSDAIFEGQSSLNYMGCVNTCKAVIPSMLNRSGTSLLGRSFTKANHPYKGEILLVSSALGVMGSIGYSAYCPTKFAVRGLGECLRQEYAPQGLDVACFYPSNMKTEGFAEEMKTKPIEAQRIDEQAATIPPEVGTEQLLLGLARGQFHTSTEWLIDAMRVLSNGISPSGTPVIELLIHPALHFVGRVYRIYMDIICEEEAGKRQGKHANTSSTPKTD